MDLNFIFGLILSGFVSLIIAYLFYKRSTKDLKHETLTLQSLNSELTSQVKSLEETITFIQDDAYSIRRTVTKGTVDNPDYPYK